MNFLSRIFGRGMSCTQVEAVLQQYLDEELEASEWGDFFERTLYDEEVAREERSRAA